LDKLIFKKGDIVEPIPGKEDDGFPTVIITCVYDEDSPSPLYITEEVDDSLSSLFRFKAYHYETFHKNFRINQQKTRNFKLLNILAP